MTPIEQAIADALAQGYVPALEQIPEAAGFSALQIAVAMKSDVFLDPAFWQALGRARGWTTDEDGKYWKGTIAEVESQLLAHALARFHRSESMIPKSGNRFSEKIMLKQKARACH